jgi:tRNA(His) 5'-end guanylyltransferase
MIKDQKKYGIVELCFSELKPEFQASFTPEMMKKGVLFYCITIDVCMFTPYPTDCVTERDKMLLHKKMVGDLIHLSKAYIKRSRL